MRPVNADAWIMNAKDTGTQFQRQEVQTDQQNPLMVVSCLLNMFQPANLEPAFDTPVWPKPRHTGFKQAHTDGFKILHHQRIAFGLRHVREAQHQITLGYCHAALEKSHGKTAKRGA
ncbi:hypothetical protein D3C81_1515690 [compost metagenome]